MQNLNQSILAKLPLNVPPLSEQKRIVARVDELMALCDQLEDLQRERELQRKALACAALARFAEAPTEANLRYLFHPSYSIDPDDLRSSIITLAIQGRLVVNHPAKPNTRQKQSCDGTAYWRSGLLGDILAFEYGHSLPAPKRTESGKYSVYGSNGVVGTHDSYLTKDPAIIVGRKGSAGALNIANGPSWTTDVAYFVVPPSELDLRFTYYLLSSLHLEALGRGIKPGLSRKEAYSLKVKVPRLDEQQRIVTRVDELLTLVETLETHMADSRIAAGAVAAALIAHLIEQH